MKLGQPGGGNLILGPPLNFLISEKPEGMETTQASIVIYIAYKIMCL